MEIFTSAVLFVSSLAGFAAAEPAVHVTSFCPFPVYFSEDVTGAPEHLGLVTVLQQGQCHRYITPVDYPVSLKFSREWAEQRFGHNPGAKLEGGIPLTQFEYNYESNHYGTGSYIHYNWSNMDCGGHQQNTGKCPFTEFGYSAERPGCPSFVCKPGERECEQCYHDKVHDPNVGCHLDSKTPSDIILTLCNHFAPGANLRRSRIWPGDDKVAKKEAAYIVNQPSNSTQIN